MYKMEEDLMYRIMSKTEEDPMHRIMSKMEEDLMCKIMFKMEEDLVKHDQSLKHPNVLHDYYFRLFQSDLNSHDQYLM